MKTSSWFTKLPPGIGRGVPAGYEDLPTYRQLAPGPWFKNYSSQQYRDGYFAEVLAKRDPCQVVLGIAGAKARVVLCFEGPPPSPSWCHRALIAWLFETIGLVVPEVGHEHR